MPEKLKHYYIVKEHPMRIISKCKSHSKGTLVKYLAGFCVLYAIMNWIPDILSLIFPATDMDLLIEYNRLDPATASRLPATPIVTFLYMVLFNGVFKLSECLYALTYIRNREVDYMAMTESLGYYTKTLGLYILQIIIISFWSMIFVIPGIIASIGFSQAFYILADDPDKKITEALAESKMMMYGNKMNYFRLLLCYLPYILLAYLPDLVLVQMASGASFNQYAFMLLTMIANIPVFAVYGYMSLGKTVFYELMINKGFADFRYAGQSAFRELEQDNNSN